MSERTFALTVDVAEAHRQAPIGPVDWHYLGAQIRPGDVVCINTVGTFCISSASYYWSRVGSSVGRLSQYISAHTAHIWHLFVADDFHLEAGGAGYRKALMIFFVLCHTAGVPLSWSKTAGGDRKKGDCCSHLDGGNGALLNKLMTTKFPGCALLMELASFMKRRSMKVVVDWTPREGNREADRLADGIVDDFSPDLEIKLDSSAMEWEVLQDALRMARQADSEYKKLKQEGRLPKRDQRKRKKRPEERLRLRDPW